MTPKTREARLCIVVQNGREVVSLGGGANGAGLLRDLGLQGVPCLLVDRGDGASTTSAAPSRLIHGGNKCLETGESWASSDNPPWSGTFCFGTLPTSLGPFPW